MEIEIRTPPGQQDASIRERHLVFLYGGLNRIIQFLPRLILAAPSLGSDQLGESHSAH